MELGHLIQWIVRNLRCLCVQSISEVSVALWCERSRGAVQKVDNCSSKLIMLCQKTEGPGGHVGRNNFLDLFWKSDHLRHTHFQTSWNQHHIWHICLHCWHRKKTSLLVGTVLNCQNHRDYTVHHSHTDKRSQYIVHFQTVLNQMNRTAWKNVKVSGRKFYDGFNSLKISCY